MSKRTARALQWLVGLALLAVLLVYADTSELGRLSRVSWPWLFGVLLATTGLVLSSVARWRMIAVRLVGGGGASFYRYVYYFLAGRALGFVLPAEVADVGVRTLALKRSEKLSLASAAYTVILDRLFDLVVLAWLVLAGVLHLAGVLGQGTALALGFAAIILQPIALGRWHNAVISGLGRLYVRLVSSLRFLPGVRDVEAPDLRAGTQIGAGASAAMYGLSVVKVAMVVARFYFVAGALSVPMPLDRAFVCVPLAQVAALVAVTPGGLGILEAGWYGILIWAGLRGEETVLLVVGWRLYTVASLVCLALGLRLWELAAARGKSATAR